MLLAWSMLIAKGRTTHGTTPTPIRITAATGAGYALAAAGDGGWSHSCCDLSRTGKPTGER